MNRKLFCELSPLTYKTSVLKGILQRKIAWIIKKKYVKNFSNGLLPYVIYKSNSLIRRRLGNVNMVLQENKAVNLSIAASKVSGV